MRTQESDKQCQGDDGGEDEEGKGAHKPQTWELKAGIDFFPERIRFGAAPSLLIAPVVDVSVDGQSAFATGRVVTDLAGQRPSRGPASPT